MKEHYNKVLRDSDARVARFMEFRSWTGTTRFLAVPLGGQHCGAEGGQSII